jgi:hypothetical protein
VSHKLPQVDDVRSTLPGRGQGGDAKRMHILSKNDCVILPTSAASTACRPSH